MNNKKHNKNYIYQFMRCIYWKYEFLQKLRQNLQRIRISLKEYISECCNSRHNKKFLDSLTSRRNDSYALHTARRSKVVREWPNLDISIVTYNSSEWLDNFFSSLLTQHYPLKIISLYIIDNGSTDETVNKIQKFFSEKGKYFAATFFAQQKNLGFGAGHDRALRQGKNVYALVTNVDIEFLPSSLCRVMEVALSDTAGAVGSWELRQFPYEHPKHYDPVTMETSWSSHACILLRRSAYEKCGGYDTAIFMYAEDVEISYRLRSYGYILKYVPSASIWHHTYSDGNIVKKNQYIGSIIGNMYIRLRYGNCREIFIGLLHGIAFMCHSHPFPNARKILAKSFFSMILRLPKIRGMKGTAQALYPFRGFDYELRRDTTLIAAQPLSEEQSSLPTVSALIRTYKGRGFMLKQAMQTIFNQTYPHIELVISEDGGNYLQKLVEEMAWQAPEGVKIRYLPNPRQGRSAIGNTALRAATAPFFFFFDDDDLLYADHIETLMQGLLAHPECVVAYAPGLEILTDINIDEKQYKEKKYMRFDALSQEWDYDILLNYNFIINTAIARRELYIKRGGFDTSLEFLEDWNLWIRYGFKNIFYYTPKTTALFRTPSDPSNIIKRNKQFFNAYGESKKRALLSIQSYENSAT
ncbi:glycosyltransferase family 2 protein [Desulfovibrio sp.]|uniref:glycosyltransferase family 2 protein n=1 Tax=Desulfovibrio sp. TaxID=885 RepID=UPI0025B8D9F5|nr:glycosyltransferase family 2 protein [Desulfovibrio sp.]